MKAEMILPSPMEAEVILLDHNGKRIKLSAQPAMLVIKPHFFRSDARPHLLFMESKGVDDELAMRGVLTISGTTGRMAVEDRSKTVLSRYDQAAKRRAAKPTSDDEEILDESTSA